MLLGEGTSSQTDNTCPVRIPIAAAQKNDSEEKATNWMNYFSCDET